MRLPKSLRIMHLFLMLLSILSHIFLFVWVGGKVVSGGGDQFVTLKWGMMVLVVAQIYYLIHFHISPLILKKVNS